MVNGVQKSPFPSACVGNGLCLNLFSGKVYVRLLVSADNIVANLNFPVH